MSGDSSITLPGTGIPVSTDTAEDGSKIQRFNINDMSFIERICLKLLTKLTFSLNGLRVDASGATVAVTISSGTVTTVSTVTSCTTVGTVSATTADSVAVFHGTAQQPPRVEDPAFVVAIPARVYEVSITARSYAVTIPARIYEVAKASRIYEVAA
jgi:hypothetical protein